jgi:hypothetical protein
MKTRRQEIINELIKRLESIKIENGYSVDIREVFDWIARPALEAEYPFVTIMDEEAKVDGDFYNQRHSLTFTVTGAIKDSERPAQAAREFAADVAHSVLYDYDDEKFEPLEYRELEKIKINVANVGAAYSEVHLVFKLNYDTKKGEI